MISRRTVMGLGLAAAAQFVSTGVNAHHTKKSKRGIPKRFRPQNVNFKGYRAGQIVIDRKNFYLYWTMKNGRARRYGVALGKVGLQMSGTTKILRKAEWPTWTPTQNMIKREPGKYKKYAGGMPGGKSNPLGARALYLYRNGRDTYYRIHGTTAPWSIGSNASNGCVRMINEHVIDLYERVPTGTRVTVIS